MKPLLMLLFVHTSLSVKHSLKYFITVSSGVTNLPAFVDMTLVDDSQIGYCDSNKMLKELKQDWMQQLLKDDPEQWDWYKEQCFDVLPTIFNAEIYMLKKHFNQSEDVHILQRLNGCEWDDQTGEISGFWQFGYNGENFISYDPKTETWVSPRPEALITKRRWDSDKTGIIEIQNLLTQVYPSLLKKYVDYGRHYLLRSVPPSVSLLQTSPSSPVSCYATGFYPHRSEMFWRKDGEHIHEFVNQGEILPNHDGTFQMMVDLNVSSIRAENWSRYDCVFQLPGLNDIITKLDKAVIRTNEDASLEIFHGVMVGLILLVVAACITGWICGQQIQNIPTKEHKDHKTIAKQEETGSKENNGCPRDYTFIMHDKIEKM